MEKRFSVIIIHRNGVNRLNSVVNSVVNACNSTDEIIIVDNASTENS